jgi:hypothetical protein
VDTAGLLANFLTNSYTVTRTPVGTVQHGKEVVGTPFTLTIQGLVYPATGQDLLRLEEGRRSNETRVVMTTTPLQVDGAAGAYEADRVLLDTGDLWEVQHRETWIDPATKSVFYRCIVQAVLP